MLTYNTENQTYSKLIHLSQFPEMKKKIEQISERICNTPIYSINNYKIEEELCIDCIDELKKIINSKTFNINSPLNRRRAHLFLVACCFCSTIEPLEYLLEQGSEINRTDMFGYNAIMYVVSNENMDDETKLKTIQMLIDKGCDVNWLTCQQETALTMALSRVDIDIANLLLDNGAMLFGELNYPKE